ncbi:MAG TPA: BsuPI-related putative proteinase inhibitor [Gaiellaceae bacterium]|nr:BsuPI-related putative proteinase inhibitor [Gaiellaceae bacterium]
MEQSAASNVSVSLEVRPHPLRSGGEAEWEFRLRNDGLDPVGLTFPTAQLGDVALEQDGSERWRWSDGKLFLQVLTERELAVGEAWSFTLEGGPSVEPGRYEAVATVRAEPAPSRARTTVLVEA